MPHTMLVNADSLKDAHTAVAEKLGRVLDYEITDIVLTPIVRVVPHEKKEEAASIKAEAGEIF